MLDEKTHLCFSLEVAQGFYLSRLAAPRIACEAGPGQFVELRVSAQISPFLRLPLSICRADQEQGTIDLLYEERGPKTRALKELPSGCQLECLGPLGNGFTLPDEDCRALLVGGGIGIPPLLFLGEVVQRQGRGAVVLLAGARSAARHLPDSLLRSAAGTVLRATDDGSLGHAGLVTEVLERELDRGGAQVVYTCGPHAMMAAVAQSCCRRQVPCQASLEAYMACGFGVCVGCVVEMVSAEGEELPVYGRYRRVCVDGPVFDSRQVRWEA